MTPPSADIRPIIRHTILVDYSFGQKDRIMGIGILAATFGYLLGTLIPHLAGARVGS